MNISIIDGTAAEKKFILDAANNGWEIIRHADSSEDMFSHWDLLVKTPNGLKTVDVKAHKHIYRNGPLLPNWLWIEWLNVRGDKGWLRGEADYIAFEYFNTWLIYERESLCVLCELLVDFDRIASRASEADYCIYTRKNRKDQTSKVMISDLNNILRFEWIT